MITFKPVVYAHQKRKDGTYNVKINVYFNGKERRLATTIVCTPADLTRSLKIKAPDILSKCTALISEMRRAVSEIPFFELEGQDVDFVIRRIRETLGKRDFALDFFIFADSYLEDMKYNTRMTYAVPLNAFAAYLGRRQMDVNLITRRLLQDFIDYLSASCSGSTVARYVQRLAAIYSAARHKYNDDDSKVIPRNPFARLSLPPALPSRGQKALDMEVMQRVISAEVPYDRKSMRLALDVFILSFLLMGANLADLYEAQKPKGDIWAYNRKKTRDRRADHSEICVVIPSEARPFLDRLTGRGKVWLAELHRLSSSQHCVSGVVNKWLRRWCEVEGVPVFTFYAARKTWATIARREGVDKALVDEALGHVGDFHMTDIYAERPWELINGANRKVLERFKW